MKELKPEIICTINTKTITPELLNSFMHEGMTIARINMSHTSLKQLHNFYITLDIASMFGDKVKVMIDLPGPELRIKGIKKSLNIKSRQKLNIHFNEVDNGLYLSREIDTKSVREGTRVFLQDGQAQAMIIEVNKSFFTISIYDAVKLRANPHISLVNTKTHRNFLSESDKEIITESLKYSPDYYALSFVESKEDIDEVKQLLKDKQVNILSKFETAYSLHNAEEIINNSDYVYIARGDLGVEVSLEKLPSIQKDLSKLCNSLNKPFFVATQMLESMVENPLPTRAEISDIGNAVFDGASGLTLSDETAIGKHPIQAIKWMKKIILANQDYYLDN